MKPDLSDAVRSARLLLGWKLVRNGPEGRTSGIIVETEAYTANDAASHSFKGFSQRNKVMFGPPGYLYVYFTYGMHYCVNIVTGNKGEGEAVLIRALEPIEGLDIMSKRRDKLNGELTNGPAKLAVAMGINLENNGQPLLRNGEFELLPGIKPNKITATSRIGINKAQDKPWRFFITGNPYVSKH